MAKSKKTNKQEKVRNIGIIAHIDAGKTTLTERILYYTGKTHRIGEVHEGTTTTDYMDDERERGITITSAVVDCPWNGYDIHLIDTPGHVDFTIEVERSLRVLDGVVVVLNAVDGVEPQTETVWRQAEKYRVPRMVFVNKMDRMGASFERSVQTTVDLLDANPLPLQMPWGVESDHIGVIDLIEMRGIHWSDEEEGAVFEIAEIPAELADEALEAREAMLESLSDVDDEIAEKYLEGEDITPDDLRKAIRQQTLLGSIVPVFCGSALKNKGVQPLLDAVGDFLPSPADLKMVEGTHPETHEPLTRELNNKEPLSALVFKVMMDEGRRLAYFRVYSGTMKMKEPIFNPRAEKEDRAARLFMMHGGKKVRVDEIPAGFIGAARGLKLSVTGDTLCDPEHPILLEEIESMEPVIMIAVELESSKDRKDLDTALDKLADEDPTFRWREDEDTGQILLSGMGELHLDIIKSRLLKEFKLPVRVGNPQVMYRETIRDTATEDYIFERELETMSMYARVKVVVEPLEEGSEEVIVIDEIPEDSPIKSGDRAVMIEAVEDICAGGASAGYPVIGVKARLLEVGTHPEIESNQTAWRAAASQAVRIALQNANTALIEPLMRVEVVVPDEFTGEVLGDLQSRHTVIQSIDSRNQKSVIIVTAALKEMFGYATDLRSRTQGRGSFTMRFDRFGLLA
jgi:elongation factor G